jgi:hypothetical protein
MIKSHCHVKFHIVANYTNGLRLPQRDLKSKFQKNHQKEGKKD